MRVKLILPALLEANDPGFRRIKYALFPPLGLVSLAAYLNEDDEVTLEDERGCPARLNDAGRHAYCTAHRRKVALRT